MRNDGDPGRTCLQERSCFRDMTNASGQYIAGWLYGCQSRSFFTVPDHSRYYPVLRACKIFDPCEPFDIILELTQGPSVGQRIQGLSAPRDEGTASLSGRSWHSQCLVVIGVSGTTIVPHCLNTYIMRIAMHLRAT